MLMTQGFPAMNTKFAGNRAKVVVYYLFHNRKWFISNFSRGIKKSFAVIYFIGFLWYNNKV